MSVVDGVQQRIPDYTPPVAEPADPRHTVEANEVATVDFDSDNQHFTLTHPSWQNTPLAPAMDGNRLDLDRVTPEMLEALGPTNTNILMDALAGYEVDIGITRGDGSRGSTEVSAATALAMRVWGSGDSEAFAKVFAAAPEQVLPYLTGNGSRVLTAENIALILREMRSSAANAGGPTNLDPSELDALGSLVQVYLERNGGDDPARIQSAMQALMGEISSTLEFTPENAGIVAGALTSGMLKHFDKIEASEELRNNIIGGVADTLSAAAGGFGPWGAAVGTAIAAAKGIYLAADPPENHEEFASRFQGAVQLEWLQNPPAGWSREDVGHAIDWINTTILNNGQR
jgi:hypothetical protein